MAGRFARSWELMKASAQVLRSDKELLVFPLVSALAVLAVSATFIVPAVSSGAYEHVGDGDARRYEMIAWSLLYYFVQYVVIFFFNTALVGAAMIRLDGGDPTVADGLRIARRKFVPIVGYAAIAAVAGVILNLLEERAGLVGRIVIALIGAAWAVGTAMVVPILVTRDVGPIDAIRGSVDLLKRNWGENLIGNGGVGLVFGLAMAAVLAIGIALSVTFAANGMGPVAIGFACMTVLALLALALVQAALGGIYSAALFRYATTGTVAKGFDEGLLKQAFRAK